MSQVAPYGSWRSPVTADRLVEKVVRLSQVHVDGDDVYWIEGRPAEAGRQVVVRHGHGDITPPGLSARTLVHEYGGGDFVVRGGVVYFSNFGDQRVYRDAEPITDDDGTRYADFDVSPDGTRVVCVRERHGREVENDVVTIATDGSGSVEVVAEGRDFFSAPRFAPDGRLAWLAWDHPNMPWDGTDLFVDGSKVAGGREESISQPRWSPSGVLHWVSDRSGWWNLYADGEPLAPMDAEFTGPDWGFAQTTFAFLADGRVVAAWSAEGRDRFGVVTDERVEPLAVPYTVITSVRPWRDGVVAIAASPSQEAAVVRIDVDAADTEVLRASRESALDRAYISEPRPVEFPTSGGRTAHALHYAPANPEFRGPDGERPPVVVMSHGGPTAATSSALSLGTQFWTTRGFAVVDVNYGGSTGYGREYRQRLDGEWGVVDVEDCVNAARWLADQGEADGDRLLIRGGSAGGYTTLCALVFRDDFAAGASYYGVADAEALAKDTHKFESRYLDRLIGPYPDAQDLYRERSPIHHVDRCRSPLILFQGLEDKVVPPAQAEVMVDALRRNGVPFAYVPFEGEQHGFRQATTIKRAAEAELSFYGQVLGFEPADDMDPVKIESSVR